MPIILKMTPIGKRAHLIDQADLDKMIADGTAVQCVGYVLFEEVTPTEDSQGYLTRNMMPLPKRRGRPPKVQPQADATLDAK